MEKLQLKPEQLNSPCNIDTLGFNTTEELEPLKGIIGQNRAVEALTFGLTVKKKGYNIYVAGLSGTGKSSYANSIAENFAMNISTPSDWLYVYNFKNPHNPKALSVEAGRGEKFKKDIEAIVEKLRREIPKIFESSEHNNKKNNVYRLFQQKQRDLLKDLNTLALKYDFAFKETDQGLATVPLKNGNAMMQEEYNNLPQEELERLKQNSQELSLETVELFHRMKQQEEELEASLKKLDRDEVSKLVGYYLDRIMDAYDSNPQILNYIHSIKQDMVENIERFKKASDNPQTQLLEGSKKQERDFFVRYKVNLFINNKDLKHGPLINEANPTFQNLSGTIEYKNEMGVLRTDFTQIKPGAIHMANGGYLILQAKDLLSQPLGWETLKRTLKTGEMNIETAQNQTGYVVTTSLKPEPIPVKMKVIIIGDSYLYNLLYNADEDFRKLFKIMADFDVEMDKTPENTLKMAKFIASHCKEVGLKHFDKTAVARVIEYSSRLADHQGKLSSQFNKIVEILYESDVWAEIDSAKYVSKEHVEKAITQRIYRNSKYEEKLNEMFEDETMLIDVDGEKVGQINGLAVMGNGQHSFGKPSRITVSTYKGEPGIISIEREAKKSGSIHDKGILVLSGYLGDKFAQEKALSLTVSISFEQNYSIIDGDSASSTELYAILSSIGEIPIKQNIAVTGSVNQKGEIQPVGGINEKIEGFFDICKIKGLTGNQGVIIPKQNVKNLMLKKEVIDSVKDGKFHIYAIGHVDEGIDILTGIPAGVKDKQGNYPKGTVNYMVTQKFKEKNDEELAALSK